MLHEFKHSNGKHSTIWRSADLGMDVGPSNKYAVVCENHGTLVGTNSERDAILVANNTHNFCDDCRKEMKSRI